MRDYMKNTLFSSLHVNVYTLFEFMSIKFFRKRMLIHKVIKQQSDVHKNHHEQQKKALMKESFEHKYMTLDTVETESSPATFETKCSEIKARRSNMEIM